MLPSTLLVWFWDPSRPLSRPAIDAFWLDLEAGGQPRRVSRPKGPKTPDHWGGGGLPRIRCWRAMLQPTFFKVRADSFTPGHAELRKRWQTRPDRRQSGGPGADPSGQGYA